MGEALLLAYGVPVALAVVAVWSGQRTDPRLVAVLVVAIAALAYMAWLAAT